MVADAQAHREGDRFVVRGKLGAGGMGVVYWAEDRLVGREVALKTLRTQSGRDLYRFKREFRALCDLVHPNLCALHELHTTGDEWFFTMELVRGVSFIDWVRPSDDSDVPSLGGDDETRPGHSARTRAEIVEAEVDLERLEDALGQLCDGLHALHLAGKLHRDLKPSNVLCEPAGRVVLLDFGLVADVERAAVERTHDRSAVGTPAYMSPEQAADLPLGRGSDWYAVGVMLYEALTGRRPFEGRADEVMRRKQHEVPPRPRDLAPDTPAYLDELCGRLLAIDPRERPDGAAILATLGRTPSTATAIVERAAGAATFVGREVQLAVLEQALLDARRTGVAVLVRGGSGMGKSALVGHFLAAQRPRALVLSGRCFPRESVPFKTLDALVDALASALCGLPAEELTRVLPTDVVALSRLFPVLRRVPQIAEPEIRRFHLVDAQELRRRGFAALRELLAALAADRPVVLAVDDLQWGDADSAVFLADLVARADRPPVLVILVYRSEDEHGPVVAAIHRRTTGGSVVPDVRYLDVPPLSPDEARELVQATAPDGARGEARADALLREAGGNTMFLAELARVRSSGATSLDQLIRERVAGLPADARALLRACAVAARPTEVEVIARAAGVDDPAAALARLRVERLVRPTRPDGDEVEPYHDRIRAAIVDELASGEVRSTHQGLASAFGKGERPRDAIVDHLLGAGDTAGAAREAERAAARATEALAFWRAAELYGIALRHGEARGAARGRILRARADALVHAGQLAAAAAAYAEAASLATGDERFALERARVEHTLRAGDLDRGVELARAILAELGYHLPRSRAAAVRKLVTQRVWLRLRGLGVARRTTPPTADEARVADTLWSVASGLSFADPILATVVQQWFLRHALAIGDPGRAAAGMALEIGFLASEGEGKRARVEQVARRARELVGQVDDPYHRGFVETGHGIARTLLGDWRVGRERIEAGLAVMRSHGVADRWQLDIGEIFLLGTLYYLGEIAELIRLTATFLAAAEERGDVYAQHGIKAWRANIAFLALGQPATAAAHVDEVVRARGEAGDFHLHDFYILQSRCQIDLYRGDGAAALERLSAARTALAGSHLRRLQNARVELTYLEGRAALLTSLADRGERERLVASARSSAAALGGEPAAWAQALGVLLAAAIAHAAGDRTAALAAYDDARERLRKADMVLHEQAVVLARAELAGEERGDAAARARAWMKLQGVVDAEAMSRLLVPR